MWRPVAAPGPGFSNGQEYNAYYFAGIDKCFSKAYEQKKLFWIPSTFDGESSFHGRPKNGAKCMT